MNETDSYRKVVHAIMWFGDKIMLAQILKPGYHKGYWTDPGGKVNDGELIQNALTREVYEETGVFFPNIDYELIDCFVYSERKIKSFLYVIKPGLHRFWEIKNTEPKKQSKWQLFTLEEALKLKLLPSVRNYLEELTYVEKN